MGFQSLCLCFHFGRFYRIILFPQLPQQWNYYNLRKKFLCFGSRESPPTFPWHFKWITTKFPSNDFKIGCYKLNFMYWGGDGVRKGTEDRRKCNNKYIFKAVVPLPAVCRPLKLQPKGSTSSVTLKISAQLDDILFLS